ncbi:MAG: hypothetical protein Q7U04_08800, partial [Bacteriovorax sp.]|nr:hypothetical protein [Bacteriovorax sp.]
MLKLAFLNLKSYQKEILIFLSFIIISLIVFSPSFLNLNYFWDDERFVFLNPGLIQAPDWFSFWNFKSEFYKSWPLGYSFFWLLIKNFPTQSIIFYKIINIIIHSLNGYLVYRFLKKLNFNLAFIISLIFLVHPMQVEAVSWVFQLLTLTAFSFFMGSLLSLLDFTESGKKTSLFLSFVFLLFSLWTKSIALLAPILFIFIFWYRNLKLSKYILLIPFFILSVYVGLSNQRGVDRTLSNLKPQNNIYAFLNIFDD